MCGGDGFEELRDRGLSPGPLMVCFNKHFILSFILLLLLVCCCCCLVAESSPTLFDPMDCSLPGSSVHGILQARILQWVAIPSSRGSSQPRDQTQVSCIAGRFFAIWATSQSLPQDFLVQTSTYLRDHCFSLPSEWPFFRKHVLNSTRQKMEKHAHFKFFNINILGFLFRGKISYIILYRASFILVYGLLLLLLSHVSHVQLYATP